METDIFYKHWKTFLTECIFLQFSICKKAENVKKITIYACIFNGKLHKIGTQKKRKEVVIRRNYQSS